MTTDTENRIADAIESAEEICAPQDDTAPAKKPRLLIENCSTDITVAALRDVLAELGGIYERGMPVCLALDQMQRGIVAHPMTPDAIVRLTHEVCRPYMQKAEPDGTVSEINIRLPRSFAVMYLDWRGEWHLPPLNGIASAPLLQGDGTIGSSKGYDATSGMWCEDVPGFAGLVPELPTREDATKAIRLIRETFKTFCFADAATVSDGTAGVPVVDTSIAPGRDESGFLVALMTAVCRPSLPLAPGLLLRAAPMSGAGAGKGLLARCINIIAFGREPYAVTAGSTAEELEKRIAAELIEGSPALFLDNLNNTAFKSNLLASAITERPARVRLLGRSQMVPLNASTFVILTGNGLTVSEDLARRFIAVDFDPGTENPEARPFKIDIRAEVTARRTELLAALLTIWRWGRVAIDIKPGLVLGNFEQWGHWVRDPLLALGCQDPAARVREAKERDGRRQVIADMFAIWWDKHGGLPIAVRDLHEKVKQALDPHGHGRQHLASQLEKLAGTRMAGFMLTRQAAAGKWGAATYKLETTGGDGAHRDHREHRTDGKAFDQTNASYSPYAPYADEGRSTNGRGADGSAAPTSLREDSWGCRDWQAFFDERAGFAEFNGGLPRAEAEAQAFQAVIDEWLIRKPASSLPGLCLGCGKGSSFSEPVLPYGTDIAGHVWLHNRCWRAWHDTRRADAIAGLAAMNIRPSPQWEPAEINSEAGD